MNLNAVSALWYTEDMELSMAQIITIWLLGFGYGFIVCGYYVMHKLNK